MKYVLANGAAVVKYPYSIGQLRADNPGTSFSSNPPESLLAECGVFPVTDTAPPSVPLNKNLVESNPVRSAGVWQQVWSLVDASADQIAARQEEAAQAQEFDAAKLDAWIVQFLAMTPAEAQTYINGNSATLAALRTNVARMAYALRVLVRREFNQ